MSLFRYFFPGLLVGILAYNDASYGNINNTDLINDPKTMVQNQSAYNVTSALFLMVAMSVIGCAFAVPYIHGERMFFRLCFVCCHCARENIPWNVHGFVCTSSIGKRQ
jgi:hypothetical protein